MEPNLYNFFSCLSVWQVGLASVEDSAGVFKAYSGLLGFQLCALSPVNKQVQQQVVRKLSLGRAPGFTVRLRNHAWPVSLHTSAQGLV